ncbi:MAG: ABC transporter substrate-binding protein [Burkholderiaceae bacterium]
MLKTVSHAIAAGLVLVATASTHAQITVGAPFALSGSVGELSAEMRKGAELAMQQVNSQGGVLGQTYRLEFADTGCNPGQAVDAVRRLIDERKVLALVGPVCSGATLRQARSVSIPAGVVTLSVASASSLISRLDDQDLVFRTAPSDALKGEAMARIAFDMGVRRVAVTHASDAYNTGIADVFSAAFQRIGGRVSLRQVHEPRKHNYQGEASAVVNAAPDVALFAYYGSGGVEYLKALFDSGRTRHVIGTDGLLAKALDTTFPARKLSQITIVKAAADYERPAFRRWEAFAREQGIKSRGPYVANAYDAAFMMALAIEAAGSADKGRISKALRAISGPPGVVILPGEFAKAKALLRQGRDIDYEGASGSVDFDVFGDIVGRTSVSRFVDGAWREKLLD